MTPPSPATPSAHDVVTGFWVPNAADEDSGYAENQYVIHNCFGITIAIMSGDEICGKGYDSLYQQTLNF